MNERILVVDDNPMNLKLVCDLLQLEGYEVISCVDAEDAITRLAQGPTPHLILMDIALPGMDGLSLTRHLRATPRYADIPIVALTAFAMKGDREKAMAAGCVGYISKPVNTRELPGQVRGFLHKDPVPSLNIMIVEDYHTDLKLAGDHARLSGHVVLSATSAEQALRALDHGHPDVVLLDLNLPGMNGPEFMKKLRADPATRDLPVVAITAFPDDFCREALEEAGCAAFLSKPVDMAQLMKALEAAAVR